MQVQKLKLELLPIIRSTVVCVSKRKHRHLNIPATLGCLNCVSQLTAAKKKKKKKKKGRLQ